MRRILLTVTVFALVLGAAAIAFGAIPAGDGTIGACYSSEAARASAARFVDDASQCNQGESFLRFHQQGPKGDPGQAGPAGAAGAPGAAGASGGGSSAGFPVPAADAFIQIDGIPGESTDAKHAGQIDVLAFDHGVSQPAGGSSGGGGGAGKATFRDFTFVHAIDKATPPLFLAAATGKHIKQATLFVRRGGGEKFEYYKVRLQDVLVSATHEHTQDSPLSGGPVESVSLRYAKIEVTYIPQKPDGGAGSPLQAGYDLKAGKSS